MHAANVKIWDRYSLVFTTHADLPANLYDQSEIRTNRRTHDCCFTFDCTYEGRVRGLFAEVCSVGGVWAYITGLGPEENLPLCW